MAKQLKAIACLRCGSTQKAEIRPDTYRCDNCGTEYFLDTDDITINVRQVPLAPSPRPAMAPVPASRIRWALMLMSLVLLWSVGVYFWKQSHRAGPDLQPDPIMTGRIEQQEPSAWRSTESALVPGAGGQPVLVVAGGRTVPGKYTYTATVGFYDARTGTAQQQVELPGGPRAQLPTLGLERLSNGTVLVCVDNAVYQVQANPPAVPNVTASLLANQPALASGVVTLDRGNRDDDALHVFTNDGHNLQLYPLTHRTYTDDEAWDAARTHDPRRPAGPVRTGFAFSEASHDYPDEPIQLLAYRYHAGDGGPRVVPGFSWRKDFGGSGVFTGADPHVKRLITPQELAQAQVLSFKDFTPSRRFFYPRVLYHDANDVLLTYYATASLGSQRFVQALDARTAAIRFTTPLPADRDVPNLALRYSGGFVIGRERTTYTLSPTGQLGPAITCE